MIRRHMFIAAVAVCMATASFSVGSTYAGWSDFVVISDNQIGAGTWFSPYVPNECPGSLADYNLIVGTEGNDNLTGTNSPDLIFGLGGNDTIAGGNGADCLVGGDGNDVIGGDQNAENQHDVLLGGPGDDRLDGGNGKDLQYGGDGHDRLDGRNGNDDLYGDAGDDWLLGSNSTDLLDGGSHEDGDTCDGGRGPEVYVNCEVITNTGLVP